MKRQIVAAIVVIGFSGYLSAAEPYEGRWAAEKGWCKNKNPYTEKRPIIINRKELNGLENRCEFSSVKKIKEGWLVSAECNGEGETYLLSFRMKVIGDILTITDEGEPGTKFIRCP